MARPRLTSPVVAARNPSAVAEPLTLSLTVGAGAPVVLEWREDEIVGLRGGSPSPWALAEPIEWGGIEALRIVSASFEDDSLLALAAIRPVGDESHGNELVEAVLRRGDEDETGLQQVLLSTEYGSDGEPTRIGIELHMSDEELPLRGAGDARDHGGARDPGDVQDSAGDPPTTAGQERRSATVLDMRLDGVTGTGLFEILRAP